MVNRRLKIPVEVAGYVNRVVLVRDDVRETWGYRWLSVSNSDYADDDFEPWDEDSAERCPF